MKVVSCKNCGAKYQIDDDEDISTYECSSCSGELELLKDESSTLNNNGENFIPENSDTVIVRCEDCGLKYKINHNENILDYECESCGGNLRYTDTQMNEELDAYLKDRQSEVVSTQYFVENQFKVEEAPQDAESDLLENIRGIPNQFDTYFSEETMQEIVEEETGHKTLARTARTTIPETVLDKFGKEFAIPKSNDYFILKDYLKEEFFKSIDTYFVDDIADDMITSERFRAFSKKLNSSAPLENTSNIQSGMDKVTAALLIIGSIGFIGGIIGVFLGVMLIGIPILLIGVILLCIGLFKSRTNEKEEYRSRIIREHLLSLSEDYYVFYNVRIPGSSSGINHLVIGPTGIYSILSQKYNPQVKLESENENNSLISSGEQRTLNDFADNSKFKYTTTHVKFEKDNKIKQKSLTLGENLINFLNENNIKHSFVEPLVGFVNNQVVVINMPLTDEDLFIEELIIKIKTAAVKLDSETIDKCAVLISKYSADCSNAEF